jgi:hypothetical protein
VSWSAHLTHTATGLAITFAQPVARIDLTPDVAEHFASLIAIEARHRLPGVVHTLEAENNQNCVTQGHVLCCDCDNCLTGDDHGKTSQ